MRTWFARFALIIIARSVQPAQGALQRLDLALIVDFLPFGQFQGFQDVVHLFERVFQFRDDLVDLFDGLGDGWNFGSAFTLGQGLARRLFPQLLAFGFTLGRAFPWWLRFAGRARLGALLITTTNNRRGTQGGQPPFRGFHGGGAGLGSGFHRLAFRSGLLLSFIWIAVRGARLA